MFKDTWHKHICKLAKYTFQYISVIYLILYLNGILLEMKTAHIQYENRQIHWNSQQIENIKCSVECCSAVVLTGVILWICLFSASSPIYSTGAACFEMPKRVLRSPKQSSGHFSTTDSGHMQAEVRPPKKMASTMNSFFLWHTEEQKKWNNDNGAHYFFTSEQEQNQMFHICSCLLGISMRMCRQCFNAAQLTARERGWRPQHWAALPVPDVPPMSPKQYNGVSRI